MQANGGIWGLSGPIWGRQNWRATSMKPPCTDARFAPPPQWRPLTREHPRIPGDTLSKPVHSHYRGTTAPARSVFCTRARRGIFLPPSGVVFPISPPSATMGLLQWLTLAVTLAWLPLPLPVFLAIRITCYHRSGQYPLNPIVVAQFTAYRGS